MGKPRYTHKEDFTCVGYKVAQDGGGKTVTLAIVKCDECPNTLEFKDKPGANPILYAQRVRKKGWQMDAKGKSSLCPTCQETPKKQAPTPQEETMVATASQPKPQPSTATILVKGVTGPKPEAPSPVPATASPLPTQGKLSLPERMAVAELYLNDAYIKGLCAFKAGASDEQGAEQSGLKLEQFIALREEDFGPLRDYAGLLAKVSAFEERMLTANQAIVQRVDALTKLNAVGNLPPQMQQLLVQKSDEFKKFLQVWNQRSARVVETFEKERDEHLTKLAEDMKATWKDISKSNNGAINSILHSLEDEKETIQGLQNELQALKALFPSELFK